jgi:hypothetical protein
MISGWTDSLPRPIQPNQTLDFDYSCRFSFSLDNGNIWKAIETRIHPGYSFSMNPVITTFKNRVFRICTSVLYDKKRKIFNGGVLEISTSMDNGNTFSDWNIILSTKSGFLDKPWIISDAEGAIHLTYTNRSGSNDLVMVFAIEVSHHLIQLNLFIRWTDRWILA